MPKRPRVPPLMLIDQIRRCNPISRGRANLSFLCQLLGVLVTLSPIFVRRESRGLVYFRAMHKTGEQICASDSFRASWQKDEPDKDIIRVTCCQMQTRRRDPLVGRKRLYFKVASLQSVSIPKQAGFSRQLRQTVVCVRVRVCLCVCVH